MFRHGELLPPCSVFHSMALCSNTSLMEQTPAIELRCPQH